MNRRLVDRVIHPRWDPGVDHLSSGFVLAERRADDRRATRRLVWFGATSTSATGVRGFGREAVPARLEIINGNGHSMSVGLFEGGRLSHPRLMEHAAEIDRHLGAETAEALDVRRTLIIEHEGEPR